MFIVTVMQLFHSALRQALLHEYPPAVLWPLADESDAPPLARQVLADALTYPRVCLHWKDWSGRWTWTGNLANSTWAGDILTFAGDQALAQINTNVVFAVSRIGGDSTCGVCLFLHADTTLSLWTEPPDDFEACLAKWDPASR